MKLRNLFLGVCSAVAVFAACQPQEENLGTPDISIDKTEMVFDIEGGDQTLTVTATVNWHVESDVDWVVVSPEAGSASADPQTVTVTVLENTGMDRTVDLKFTIGMKSKYLTVSQTGPGGSPEALIVYFNDFDKEEAEKDGDYWPYLDQFEGWKNATGTGAANVDYEFKGMSARSNSGSNGSYSDYAGSGKNNMFFGSSAYLATKNIALGGAKDFTLTFGTEKYSQDNGSVFTNSEFHIYLSQDGTKWVELTDYTFAGGETEGRWNIAKANFSVPEGTENLSICMQADVASSYRMDDMKLVISEGGATVDFSTAAERDFTKPTNGGQGEDSDATAIYNNNYDKEVATKTYGSGSSWPYLDQFEDWKNAAGTGAANVSYTFSGVSARNNQNSNTTYSDYDGSGLNNIFFGTNAYFATNNIALNGETQLTLTFGAVKYAQDGDSKFSTSEYHVFLSNDGTKWVELPYEFAGTNDGRWNVATAHFTVPAGTENLSICMQADVASVYRLDDLKLVAGTEVGTVVDFSQGVEKDFAGGGNQGGGESDATAIYSNNYDRAAAVKDGNYWPYPDQSDCWQNAAGTGAANVTYNYKNVTVRNNSNSDGSYSDYAGSGLNNIFFGKDYPYFSTNNIALNGATSLELTFGTEKFSQTDGSTFTNSEYHIWLSNDGTKWVELTDYTFAGTADGRWNVATANFTVPAGTENLSICMQVDVESSYRLDDFKLVSSTTAGTQIDFAQGVEKDFNAGATGGGNEGGETPTPPTPPAGDGSVVTIAEFLANGGSAIEGVVISNMDLNNLTSKKGMYIQDETAGLQFFLAANHTFAFGDKVRVDVSGVTVGAYNGAVQVSGLALDKITKISSGNTVTPKTVTMADFLANKYEGQYIALEGVQVASADLSKTFVMGDAHTSINMEDANGNKFVVFSSKYATYGTTAVPQGSGTIKGISSINNGNMQIIFAQNSDFAGLTGTRFDGTEVTPPTGGGDEGGEDPVTPPAGGEGEYDSNITWTLGNKAYDKTSGDNAQYGTVNGVSVDNMLKLGTSSLVGDATLHIPAGTKKIGFYCIAWNGKKANVKFSVNGTQISTVAPKSNTGANNKAPYTITVTSDDYYEVEMPSTDAADVKVETLENSAGRALFIGIKAIAE